MVDFTNPVVYGLNKQVENSAFKSTDEVYSLVGENTGNLAFTYAIHEQLEIKNLARSWSSSLLKNDGDIGVMPCANQVGEHADMKVYEEKVKCSEIPIVAIGIGAQAGINQSIPNVPEGTIRWLKAIVDKSPSKAPNIGVRGPFTKKVLSEYGFGDSVEVLGCPTLYINPDQNLGEKIEANIRFPNKIAVASGHQRWFHLSKLEQSLVRLVESSGGSYVAQSPKAMVKLCRAEVDELSQEDFDDCRNYIAPDKSNDEFISWTKQYGNVFFSVDSWMEHYRKFDFVIGLRIHGIMLALQAGVPGICIAHDSRTLELCEFMKVPFVKASDVSNGIDRNKLLDLLQFNGKEFDEHRKLLARNYLTFLKNNGLKASKNLEILAG